MQRRVAGSMIASIFSKILECGFLKGLSKINELTDAVQMYKKLSRVCNDPCKGRKDDQKTCQSEDRPEVRL